MVERGRRRARGARDIDHTNRPVRRLVEEIAGAVEQPLPSVAAAAGDTATATDGSYSIGFHAPAVWSYCIHRELTPSHWMYALRAASHCGSPAVGSGAVATGAAATGGAIIGAAEGEPGGGGLIGGGLII